MNAKHALTVGVAVATLALAAGSGAQVYSYQAYSSTPIPAESPTHYTYPVAPGSTTSSIYVYPRAASNRGTVEAIQLVREHRDSTAYIGNEVEKRHTVHDRLRFTVRLDDGSTKTFMQDTPEIGVGDRVRIASNGVLVLS